MKNISKIILSLTLFSTLASADISNQTSNSHSTQKSSKESLQKNINQSDTKSTNKTRGNEKSINQNLSHTLSEIKSVSKSVSKSKTGTWSIQINPIPYILMQMRALGWDKRAFSLKNSDVGTSYFVDDDEDIIDMNAQAFYDAKSKMRGHMDRDQIRKLQNIIVLLNYSGEIASKASDYMKQYYNADISNIKVVADAAVRKAYAIIKPRKINIYKCSYGGTEDIYNCNDSEYTVMLTHSVPTLLKNGIPYYSAEKIGYATPMLTLSFATSDNEALTKLMQDNNSRAVVQSIRAYTSYLEQHGQSEVASKIKSAVVEKALTTNLSTVANATVQAINSGSPLDVLRIFK